MVGERVPCRHCGEAILKTARRCPHCGGAVLFDVVLNESIVDERNGYHLARSLERLAIRDLSFLDLKQRIEAAPGVLMTSVTAFEAEECRRVLRNAGIGGVELRESCDRIRNTPRSSAMKQSTGRLWRWLAVVSLLLLAIGWVVHSSLKPEPDVAQPAARTIADRVVPSTVQLVSGNQTGAGFFVTPELICSNAHVVKKSQTVDVVFESGLVAKGRVRQRDDWFDYAIIEVKGANGEPLPVADATTLKRGDTVFLAGNPRGLDFTFSKGIVSHPERFIYGIAYVQIDAAVNPGNSGGPLLNERGEAVGLVTMVVGEGSNLGLALPINYLRRARRLTRTEAFAPLHSDAWADVLDRARAHDREVVEEFLAREGVIEVLGFDYTESGRFHTSVLQWNTERPGPATLHFSLVEGETTLCRPSGEIMRWRHGASRWELRQLNPRMVEWLDHNRLLEKVYVGATVLDMRGCPDPTTVLRANLRLETVNGGGNG